MGRLEKIVVMTVVLLIAVILAYALSDGKGEPGPIAEGDFESPAQVSGPNDGPGSGAMEGPEMLRGGLTPPRLSRSAESGLSPSSPAASGSERGSDLGSAGAGNDRTVAPAPGVRRSGRDSVARDETFDDSNGTGPAGGTRIAAADVSGSRSRGLLNSSVKTAEVEALEGSILKSRAGLEPTPDEEFWFYTWREDDTFTSVARELYGDLSLVRLLRNANEDQTDLDLRPGDRILVPAFDGSRGRGPAGIDPNSYTVLEGDTLSSIARKVYGDSSVYMKIFEANRDLLQNPDTVAQGQVLRIPR